MKKSSSLLEKRGYSNLMVDRHLLSQFSILNQLLPDEENLILPSSLFHNPQSALLFQAKRKNELDKTKTSREEYAIHYISALRAIALQPQHRK